VSAPEVPTVGGPDLAAYLRACLDEREAAALQAQEMARYRDGMDIQWKWALLTKPPQFAAGWSSSFEPGAPSPDEVLADIAAKRAIIDGLMVYEPRSMDTDGAPIGTIRTLAGRAYRQALLVLAQAFATRDDFDPSWRTAPTAP
jgi:hypothetical protein